MLASRSSVYKMLEMEARQDRRIKKYPRPFSLQMTPYRQNSFSPEVKTACSSFLPLMAGLKISKAIVLGDVSTGKTSLIRRFCHKCFNNNYKATIGVDFEVERFDILNIPFNLQIWDTAGQERFKCIAAAYYRSAHVIVTVFDLTNMTSLYNCINWLKEAMESNTETPLIFLVGTKFDLLTSGVYSVVEKRAAEIGQRIGAEFWAVSSKTGDGVDELFLRVAALAFDRIVMSGVSSLSPQNQVKLGNYSVNLSNKNMDKKTSNCEIGLQNCKK